MQNLFINIREATINDLPTIMQIEKNLRGQNG